MGRMMGLFGVVPFFKKEGGSGGEQGDEGFEVGGMVIGRIDVNEIELGRLLGEEREGAGCVSGDEGSLGLELKCGDIVFNAGGGVAVLFDKCGVRRAAAEGFQAHGPAAGVEIEKAGIGDFILADVEDRFAEHPLRRASGGAFWCFKTAAFERAGDDAESH